MHDSAFNKRMKFDDINIETERVTIQVVRQRDQNSLYKIYSDPAVMKYWSCPPFTNESQAAELINSAIGDYDAGKSLLLAITLKESSEFIGTLSLFNLHPESRRAEIGYILSRAFWRKGLMSEIVEAFIIFCFDDLNLNRLEADIDPENKASSALLNKFGFRLEGRLKERWIVDGKTTDSEIYGLVKANHNSQTN